MTNNPNGLPQDSFQASDPRRCPSAVRNETGFESSKNAATQHSEHKPSEVAVAPASPHDTLIDTNDGLDDAADAASTNRVNPASLLTTNTLVHGYHTDPEGEVARVATEGNAIVAYDDVEFISEVEWGPEDSSSVYGELATRPKPDAAGDPCGCTADTNTKNANRTKEASQLCCMDPSCILFACQEECRSNCEAGAFCGNKRIQRKQYKSVEVFLAGPKGRGLRVLEDVKKGDFITEYIGRAVRASYLSKLFQRYKQERRLYIMALDSNVYLDARRKGSVARYINHSCSPNCVVERWKVRGILRAGIFASEDISKGTELSFDYQWERKKGRAPTKCYCGAPNCRGTLEVPKSLEEQDFENLYEGHWKPGPAHAGREIINRSIRILSREHQQFFYADVCKYDETTRKHLVIYRYEWEEAWENLLQEEWQLLDEDVDQNEFVISKKTRPSSWRQQGSDDRDRGLVGSGLLAHFEEISSRDSKELNTVQPYLYVQTPIKEAFWEKHLVQRCERNCRVTIRAQQFSRLPLSPNLKDPDEFQKSKALEQSLDGIVWKLSVSGYNVAKACTILEKNVLFLTKKMEQACQRPCKFLGNNEIRTSIEETNAFENNCLVSSLAGVNIHAALASDAHNSNNHSHKQEVILPRCTVDIFKQWLPSVRERYKTVNMAFVHSGSKSKAFAKLLVEANLLSDLCSACEGVWLHLLSVCAEVGAPKSETGSQYTHLGFLGGELPKEQFCLLFSTEENHSVSSFLLSFQSFQQCSLWVQVDEDMGRIDGENKIVGQAAHNSSRKVFFGCHPQDVQKLWGLVQSRALEVARGVKYLYLGGDEVFFQRLMLQHWEDFFEFVEKVAYAHIEIDQMTGDHFRIDGSSDSNFRKHAAFCPASTLSDIDRVALAVEIVRLQIEIYRDHYIRKDTWIFGRDWSLFNIPLNDSIPSGIDEKQFKGLQSVNFNDKTVANSCREIAEVTIALGAESTVGAGAVTIFHRYSVVCRESKRSEHQFKARELLLACIFLASKLQRSKKSNCLDKLLEAAYQIFYPGADFDLSKEEVIIMGQKVVLVEDEILTSLKFDVFWSGSSWMLSAVVNSAGMDDYLAKEALAIACSGLLLAAGPLLWLKYGLKYIFSTFAVFLGANLDALCSVLSLHPMKLMQAVEIIVQSVVRNSTNKDTLLHEHFGEQKGGLRQYVPGMKEKCLKCAAGAVKCQGKNPSKYEVQIKQLMEQVHRRHKIQDVSKKLLEEIILPQMGALIAGSNCKIFIEKNASNAGYNVFLEGSWRAVAFAYHLLNEIVANFSSEHLPMAVDVSEKVDTLSNNKIHQKTRPGFVKMHTTFLTGAGKFGCKIVRPGQLEVAILQKAGLRWWIPPQYCLSQSGSICEMFFAKSNSQNLLSGLHALATSLLDDSQYPILSRVSPVAGKRVRRGSTLAISLQQWPPEKIKIREATKWKKANNFTGLGFSAAALREMQVLKELHSMMPSPEGHPNFVLPVAVGLPSKARNDNDACPVESITSSAFANNDIFSLFRTSEQNERISHKVMKVRGSLTGPQLICQHAPFALEGFANSRKSHCQQIGSTVFSAWVHDLLSALVHCHSNQLLVRFFNADHIIVDHSGVVKFGGLYKTAVAPAEHTRKDSQKGKKGKISLSQGRRYLDDSSVNPYSAPELILGSDQHTNESDIWSLGCLLANILLGKSLFSGKERQALLMSIYKVVGSPAKRNYEAGARLPHYRKPSKKYKRGVGKAFHHALQEDCKHYQDAIDLLSQMLCLDPAERITASEALQHEYMRQYVEKVTTQRFAQQFAFEWSSLKTWQLKLDDKFLHHSRQKCKQQPGCCTATDKLGRDEDELYNLEEFFPSQKMKKRKLC